MKTMKAIKTTVAPEDWGDNSFPEGMSTLQEVEQWLDDNCSDFSVSIYFECRRQLQG